MATTKKLTAKEKRARIMSHAGRALVETPKEKPRAAARYSDDEKRRILNEAYHISSPGVVVTCKKYGLSPATIYKWKTALGITAAASPLRLPKPKKVRKESVAQRANGVLFLDALNGEDKDCQDDVMEAMDAMLAVPGLPPSTLPELPSQTMLCVVWKDLTPEPLSWERGALLALSSLPTKATALNYTLGFHLYSDEHHVYIARSVSRRLSHLQEDVLAIPKQAIVETLSLLSYEHQDDRRARIDAYKKASTTR